MNNTEINARFARYRMMRDQLRQLPSGVFTVNELMTLMADRYTVVELEDEEYAKVHALFIRQCR